MNYTYHVSETEIIDEKGAVRVGYGIEVRCGGKPMRVVSDIFTDREDASRLVSLCCRLELSPTHLDDVIADAILQ